MRDKIDLNFIKRRIRNKRSLSRLKDIKENWKLVIEEGKIIKDKRLFDIKIGKYRIWLRKESSASSIMTFLEIFKYRQHTKHPEFLGKKDNIVFDIGANEGFYTLWMKRNNPKLKIVALEPVPSTFKLIEKNVRSNKLKDVILVNKALTSKKGKIKFEIVPEVSAICATDINFQKRPWLDTGRIKKIRVNSTSLNDLCKEFRIDHIDILKMDVEGSEMEILKSSKKMLKNISKIIIEFHSKKLKRDCINLLKKSGFKFVYEDKKKCGDIYFINKR